MQFQEIYDNFDDNFKHFANDNNLQQVDCTNLNDSNLFLENQFSFKETTTNMKIYSVHQSSMKIVRAILLFDDALLSRLDQFLKNIGHFFIEKSSDSLALEEFNQLKDTKMLIIGKNHDNKDFIGLRLNKHNVFIRITAENIIVSAGYLLTAERPLTDDINVDFSFVLDDFIKKIAQSTGFEIDSNFQENIGKTTISERINAVFVQKGIKDIVYIDKNDVLKSMLPYKEKSKFTIGVDDFSFAKEDDKTMLILLSKLFFNDTYKTLSDIITVVINYQKAMHREDKLHIGFPVNSRFYDTEKLPVIKIYLNEKYQLGFSANGYIFTNNAVPQYVKDYKRLPEVLNKILEESERHVDRATLTKQLN